MQIYRFTLCTMKLPPNDNVRAYNSVQIVYRFTATRLPLNPTIQRDWLRRQKWISKGKAKLTNKRSHHSEMCLLAFESVAMVRFVRSERCVDKHFYFLAAHVMRLCSCAVGCVRSKHMIETIAVISSQTFVFISFFLFEQELGGTLWKL